MKSKLFFLLLAVMSLTLIIACSEEVEEAAPQVEVTKDSHDDDDDHDHDEHEDHSTLEEVLERGDLKCGVNDNLT